VYGRAPAGARQAARTTVNDRIADLIPLVVGLRTSSDMTRHQ
jgi:hypothetical protein